MSDEELIYSLNIEDVQTVAMEVMERTLSRTEIEKIQKFIEENISWYDAIADAIHQYFSEEEIQSL
ncbi:hypothetical protein H8E88_05730 [candidate division KSB1 bacterium]|nr:hypothetical protein [candidate division KSB1 bacterium]MBL7095158.1 hypothetical protein [candidate division KSB1 bacterium]